MEHLPPPWISWLSHNRISYSIFVTKEAGNEHLAIQHDQDILSLTLNPRVQRLGSWSSKNFPKWLIWNCCTKAQKPPQNPSQSRQGQKKPSSTWMAWAVPWAAFRGRETLQRSFRERAASSKICCTVWVLVEKPCRDAWSGTCITGLETFYILYFNHYENVILINGFNPAGAIPYLR